MPDIEKNFKKNLALYLNLKGVTQEELAKYLNVGSSAVSNWIQGLNMPRMNKIDKICEFFVISRSDLLESSSEYHDEKTSKISILARNMQELDEEQINLIETMINQLRSK